MIPTALSPLSARALQALRQVMDPELGVNVVDLGLVASLDERLGALSLGYKLTSASCPVGEVIARGMREALETLEGCRGVEAVLLDEPWSPDDMTAEGRQALGIPDPSSKETP